MEYSKLVAVTGMPGLYELINSKGDGAIIRSLDDNTTKFASSRIHNFSHLESIEIYTTGDNVNLVDIFHAMEKGGGTLPDGKDNDVLKKYFEKVFPEIDFDRVYSSDLKKMVKWFEQLKKHKIEIKLSEPIEEEEVEEEPVKETKPKAAKEPKAAAKEETKKPAPKAEKKEEKPVKKAAPAKETKKKEEAPAKKKAATKEKKEAPKKKTPPKKK